MNPRHTPWGHSQSCTHIADGVEFHSTSSHGGFWVAADRHEFMPEPLRLVLWKGDRQRRGAWYEEDVDWCMVALAFPSAFSEQSRLTADEVLRNWRPERWEALYDRVLQPGESEVKDRRQFERLHAQEWVVISARGDWSPNVPGGHVGVVATLGGQRQADAAESHWLVPADEYRNRSGGFVIDPARHERVSCSFRAVVAEQRRTT